MTVVSLGEGAPAGRALLGEVDRVAGQPVGVELVAKSGSPA